MQRNPQIEMAEEYVMETGVSIFLTGKAGTGKTTFLHHIVEHCHKRLVVLAPTGVAAVNAGGVTIHSFFQLPFCPYLPDVKELVTEYQMPEHKRQLRKSKIDIIRTLDLLVIDEISMVRADLLDAIDDTLRRYRRSSRPFGGVQLLMIGDVQQLAPVVTDDERPYMDRVYPSPFFFHSKALQRIPYITIQLQTIYRQQDPTFVNLLNNIRDNHFDEATLDALNKRVVSSTTQHSNASSSQQDPILLTTHNYQADRVNKQRLDALASEPFTLHAQIRGNFPEANFPTDEQLVLKPGAQVMFVKNDGSGAHRYYNGKIGTVEELGTEVDDQGNQQELVLVRDEDGDIIRVSTERWENIKYEIDPADNQIKQVVDGTFDQYPLKTAWAITIHKAQGLTFDRVQVDAAAAFAYGQVYVALSRCRSLEGLTLLSPITQRNSFGSRDIESFTHSLTSPEVAQQQLQGYRVQYYFDVLFELFGFSSIQHEVENIERIFQDNLRSTYPQQALALTQLVSDALASLMSVSERFRQQLAAIGQLPESDRTPLMAERISKATAYFLQQIRAIHQQVDPLLNLSVDNKDVAARLKDTAERYRSALGLKETLLKKVQADGFDIVSYQQAKVNFTLQKPQKTASKKESAQYETLPNPKLAKTLTRWRTRRAKEMSVPAYVVLQQKSLVAICEALPRDKKSLSKVPGLGAAKISQFGAELLQMVEDYVDEKETRKVPAWQTAASLLAEGNSIDDVAGQMLRAVSTVEGYLLTAVENGVLDPDLLVAPEQQDEIMQYVLDNPKITALKPIYDYFEGRYSYLQLRVARFVAQDLIG